MVEFGLKLEDNKVSEWSEHYLNYEKLKAVLKAAKAAQKKFDENAKRRPLEAKMILEAHRAGNPNLVTITPSGSRTNLQQLGGNSPSGSQVELSRLAEEPMITESTKLLPPNVPSPDRRSSNTDLAAAVADDATGTAARPSMTPPKSLNTITSAISDISDYFGSRYERTMRGYLKEIDDKSQEFELCMKHEQEKSVQFYNDKLRELQARLDYLIENVEASPLLGPALLVAPPPTEPNPMLSKQLSDEEASGQQQHKFMRSSAIISPALFGRKSYNPGVVGNPKERIRALIVKFSNNVKKDNMEGDDGNDDDEAAQEIAEVKRRKRQALHKDDSDDEGDDDHEGGHEQEKIFAEADSIKRSLTDQYRTAKLLQNYAILNYTGFVKIAKKHDKTLPEFKGKFKSLLRPENLFNEGKAVDELSTVYETYYANWFCEGDNKAARAQLLPKRGDGLEMDWSQLRLGYRMGMCAVLAVWVCWDCIWGLVSDDIATIGGRAAFPVFRACGGILLLQWFWGFSVFIWNRYRVNYIYLFDFNPRIVSTPLEILKEAVDNTLVFMLLMLLYYKSGAHAIPQVIPAGGYPFILVLCTCYKLIFPLRTRVPMWIAIRRVVTAPLTPPSFFHGYVGDIFTSMVKVFQDVVWTLCWVFSGDFLQEEDLDDASVFEWSKSRWYKQLLIPAICLMPLVFRFNQCLRRYADTGDRFPHLANAAKYAMSQTVTLFGAFHPLYLEYSHKTSGSVNLFQIFWMVLFVSSSLYSFTWDVYMDWGLGRPSYNFLGPSLMYPRRYYYYSVMAIDLVLRFMWVLTLVPPSSGAKFEVPSYLSAMTMMLELFRRTIWGFFRLENEHRSNAAGFRRVSFVPLHFTTGHHHHGYKDKKEQNGMVVLREVVLVALAVVGVCVSSIVAAQKANREFALEL